MEPKELLKKNLAYYQEMKALVAAQIEILTAPEDISPFFKLFNQRGRLQAKITANERKLQRIRPQSPAQAFDQTMMVHIREAAIEVLQSIQTLDRQLAKLVEKHRDTLLFEIRGLRRGQKGLKGYGNKIQKNSYHINKQG